MARNPWAPTKAQLRRKAWLRERAIGMHGMRSQGQTLRQIAEFFGVAHPNTVRRILARAIPPEPSNGR